MTSPLEVDGGAPVTLDVDGGSVVIGTAAQPEIQIDVDPPPLLLRQGQLVPAEDVIVVPGPAGPRGPTGGEPFEWHQATPAATWIVNHDLGHYPQVSIADDSGALVLADVIYSSLNVVTVIFSSPRSGWAYLV